LNGIVRAGDHLTIRPEPDFQDPDACPAIRASLFDMLHPEAPAPGALSLADFHLTFQSQSRTSLSIHLSKYLESMTTENPLGGTPLLAISYSGECGPAEYEIVYFTGTSSDLRRFNLALIALVRALSLSRERRDNHHTKSGSQLRIGGTSTIIDDGSASEIRNVLPNRFRGFPWFLVFQLSTDGSSYATFFQFTDGISPALLLVRNGRGDRFGCYSSDGFRNSRQYYGTGETFVFRMTPAFEMFGWTKVSEFFVSSCDDEIAVGGGGNSAIWIDRNMLNGFSEACPTFGSPALARERKFKIVDIEVWGIGVERIRKTNSSKF
jgi:hypothetical protein